MMRFIIGHFKSIATAVLAFGFLVTIALGDSLERHGAESADDGQETIESGAVNIDYSYVELRSDLDRWGGACRFPNVTIAQGATINSAYIAFVCYTSAIHSPVDSIACEDVDNATVLTATMHNISDRWDDRTDAAILWQEDFYCLVGQHSDSTDDLKTMVQEVVDRPGWESGNAMMFLFKCTKVGDDSSYFEFDTWDASDHTYGPILYVDYTSEAPEGRNSLLLKKQQKK